MLEYYSAIKKNEIMPFAETWMDLEILTLSEVSQTEKEKNIYHLCVESNKKMIQMKFSYRTETDSQTWKSNLWLPKGKHRGK